MSYSGAIKNEYHRELNKKKNPYGVLLLVSYLFVITLRKQRYVSRG